MSRPGAEAGAVDRGLPDCGDCGDPEADHGVACNVAGCGCVAYNPVESEGGES